MVAPRLSALTYQLVLTLTTLTVWIQHQQEFCVSILFFSRPPDFDGHGWNMAVNYDTQRLMGMYDFGDAGFGELHEEFIYTSFISVDLTSRVIGAYEQITGRTIERNCVYILTGVLLLTELAEMGKDADLSTLVLQNALNWLDVD